MVDFIHRHFILVPVHPLVWCTAGLIAGVATYYIDAWWLLGFAVTVGICGIGLLLARRVSLHATVPILCIAGGLLLGWLRAGSQVWLYQRACTAVSGTGLRVVAVVTDRMPASHRFMRECLTLSQVRVQRQDEKSSCYVSGKIQLYAACLPDLRIGDTIRIDNVALKPPKQNGFGRYLMRNGIVGTAFVPRPAITIGYRPTWSFWRMIWEKRQQMLHQMQRQLSLQAFALYSSLFLGNRAVCRKEVDRMTPAFQQWGIMHYLARSGLHLVIFAAVWTLLFRFIPIPLLYKQLLLVLLAVVYALFSWLSLSFVRALAVFMLYQLCGMLRVPFHFLYCLTLVCCVVVLFNPVQVLFLDFQLSFALTFALGWFGLLRRAERLA